MIRKIALVLYYDKPNRYSFNALAGAIETDEYFNDMNILFVTSEDKLIVAVKQITHEYETLVIGISFATTQLWDTYRLITKLKQKCPNSTFYVAGGPHPTGDPIGTLRMGFDIVVVGEGEETLIELLKRIDNDEDYHTVKGIGLLDDQQKYSYTGRRSHIDLNKYPPFAIRNNKFGPIEITRGCPFACYFCQTPYILGGHPRHRSVEKICEYVQIMKDRNLRDFRCITPNAFSYGSVDGKKVDTAKLDNLLSSVKKTLYPKGRIFFGSFPSEVRPEHVTKETIKLILEYADNDNLIIGAQSGSQRVLDFCHRGHSVEDIYNAVELTLGAGLKANVDFIFGIPGEDEEDVKTTLNVMNQLVTIGARVHAHTFMPLPQTPFAKKPATGVDRTIRKMIRDNPQDVFYGDWREQERIARRISKYLRTGKLRI